ncbi:MAG: 4-hydroxyphenylacetate 3-monooxygenase, oxygenase component [Chloroflexi bacterium]|nr:4-hydroxyphenylacetate 3-monooxygenase, oxygenase component [Chloroflexota bacterium]
MATRTGAEYLAGLRDGREIWLHGERVADVTTHPKLAGIARSVADLYDMQHDPALKDTMTYTSPSSGQPVGLSFIEPRTPEDLVRRRQMFRTWAEYSGGMLGRSPDYMNCMVAGCAIARDYIARNGPEYAERMVAFYEWAREHDVCMTHTLIQPQQNRSKGPNQQADPTVPLHIVGENAQGMVVTGARMLATLAPTSDELVVMPSTIVMTGGDASAYAYAFSIPVASPGLKFVCRGAFDSDGPEWDHPLSSRFEEMDAVAVFDEVLVPWQRVFMKGDMDLCNGLFRRTNAYAHAMHQFLVKNLVKAEFMLGLASLMTQAIGTAEFPNIQAFIGEMVDDVETLWAFIRAAEAEAQPHEGGVLVPDLQLLLSARNFFPRVYPRLVEIVQLLGSSGLMATPTGADIEALPDEIDKYYQASDIMGIKRIRLFRLAWDAGASSFAGRQALYERFFSGDPFRLLTARSQAYDRGPAIAMVKRILERIPLPAGAS